MTREETFRKFEDYIEHWPFPDQPGFDGIHYGGIKGLKPGAPDEAIQAYAKYVAEAEEGNEPGKKEFID